MEILMPRWDRFFWLKIQRNLNFYVEHWNAPTREKESAIFAEMAEVWLHNYTKKSNMIIVI